MIIVLVTEGKHESVDRAYVKLFGMCDEAEAFCQQTCTGYKKHWVNAEIVDECEVVELCQPQE